jgi:hypothetical protein
MPSNSQLAEAAVRSRSARTCTYEFWVDKSILESIAELTMRQTSTPISTKFDRRLLRFHVSAK